MPALKYWLWLSDANVSVRAKAMLVRHFGGAEAAFFAPEGEFKGIEGITTAEAAVLERRDAGRASQITDACAEQGIHILTMQDAAYPKRLKNIFAPPPVLYVKGRLPAVDENALVAVIGTRNASPYGLKMGREMAWQIARCGGIVVSCMAQGINTEAIRAALTAGGSCVGVLGRPHSPEDSRFERDVAAGGALVSEYAPGISPQPRFFREQNRIAAGLSVGAVVIEAPEKSGTRLFAAEALEQGKEIFAVPGNADSENSAGTLALIKEGAKLVTCGAEVMSEFESLFPDKIRLADQRPAPEISTPQDAPEKKKREKPEKKSVDKENDKSYIDWKEQLASLTENQLKIITAIEKDASHIDDIIEATGLPTATVLAQLTVLEIRGYVRREAGRRIALNITKK